MNYPIQLSNQYRPDIDGLRAIAVLCVIFFHAGFNTFSGGFVGVDIFFVISGYLITTIILNEKTSGTLSIVKFYERRARRIIPALFFVIFITTLVGAFIIFPKQFVDYGRSIIAVSFFASNILFNQDKQTGYFNGAADEKPLLHTWSLAVEEQYYLFFPVFIILFWKVGRNKLLLMIVLITLMSLGLSDYASRQGWLGNFFLIPTRAWELLIGSILAFFTVSKSKFLQVSPTNSTLLSLVGLSLLMISIFVFDSSVRFPSIFALVPTIGTALIIAFPDSNKWSSHLLSNRLLVGIGLISYSTYLWHQPIFVMAKITSIYPLTKTILVLLILLTIVLAYFTWRFIEQPFRNKSLVSQKKIFSITAVGSVLLIITGLLIIKNDGFENRFSPKINQWLNPQVADKVSCIDQFSPIEIRNGVMCKAGNMAQSPTFAVIGDSHAEAMLQALNHQALIEKRSFFMVSGGWCAPLLDFAGTNKYFASCRETQNAGLNTLAENKQIKTVILIAEWPNYTEGYRWGSNPTAYFDAQSTHIDIQHNPEVFERALKRTIDLLMKYNKNIVIVKTVPEFNFNVTDILIKNAITGQNLSQLKITTTDDYEIRNRNVSKFFNQFKNINYVEPKSKLCDTVSHKCEFKDALGNPMYSDSSHLTFLGASKIVPDIFKLIPNK